MIRSGGGAFSRLRALYFVASNPFSRLDFLILPLAPTPFFGESSVVQRALQVLRTNEQLSELEPLLAFFASFVLETQLVQQIMRWDDIAILRESPWYQEILQQGLQHGRQEGFQQGRRQELLSGIELGLELKFGSESLQILSEIFQIEDVERLRSILTAIKTANSLEELRQIYK